MFPALCKAIGLHSCFGLDFQHLIFHRIGWWDNLQGKAMKHHEFSCFKEPFLPVTMFQPNQGPRRPRRPRRSIHRANAVVTTQEELPRRPRNLARASQDDRDASDGYDGLWLQHVVTTKDHPRAWVDDFMWSKHGKIKRPFLGWRSFFAYHNKTIGQWRHKTTTWMTYQD